MHAKKEGGKEGATATNGGAHSIHNTPIISHIRRLDATLVKNLKKRPNANLSMKESAHFLLGSRYLRYMATLVLGALQHVLCIDRQTHVHL